MRSAAVNNYYGFSYAPNIYVDRVVASKESEGICRAVKFYYNIYEIN